MKWRWKRGGDFRVHRLPAFFVGEARERRRNSSSIIFVNSSSSCLRQFSLRLASPTMKGRHFSESEEKRLKKFSVDYEREEGGRSSEEEWGIKVCWGYLGFVGGIRMR